MRHIRIATSRLRSWRAHRQIRSAEKEGTAAVEPRAFHLSRDMPTGEVWVRAGIVARFVARKES